MNLLFKETKMKKFLPKYFIVLGGIGLTWFVLPVVLYGIISLGNVVGAALFFLIILYGLNFEKVNTKIKKFSIKKNGKIIISLVCAVIFAAVSLIAVETVLMVGAAGKDPAPDSTVVVLGCKANGENPSRMLLRRLQATKKFLDENPEAMCVVSGGQGSDETISEAQCMYGWLVKNGISPDRIFREDKSTSTRENLLFSKAIIEKENLNGEITIVTNEFHQYRAGRIADALGIEHAAVSGMTPVVLFPTYYVRELFAVVYEWVM